MVAIPKMKVKQQFVKTKKPRKISGSKINRGVLKHREEFVKKLGYEKQKWVYFCEVMLDNGFELYLYEAKETVSKYITVCNGEKEFKVRFSNHPPIRSREIKGDCDFFVGRTNFKTTNTTEAIMETLRYFGVI